MHTLVFNGRDEMIKITANEIVFIVADGNYSRARLTTGKDQLLSINLSNVYALLENQLGSWSDQFVRVGRDLIKQNCCIYSIHTLKKRLILKVHETGKYYELEVSKEALKKLKTKQELDLQNRTTNIQLKDNKTQEVYPLQTGNNFFGRKSSSVSCTHPIVNGDTKISRMHFNIIITQVVELSPYKLMIIDQNSINGTFVNGKSISPSTSLEINIGSIIKAGNSEFTIVSTDDDKTELDVV